MTLIAIGLVLLVVLSLVAFAGHHVAVQSYAISTRDLPDTAPDLHADPRTVDTSG